MIMKRGKEFFRKFDCGRPITTTNEEEAQDVESEIVAAVLESHGFKSPSLKGG